MSDETLPPEFLERLKLVRGKRATIVIEHILKHGYITTEDLEITYGYKHPPRAVRDVREQGIPITSFTVKDQSGRSISAYRFGNLEDLQPNQRGRRNIFPKAFKHQLFEIQDGKCSICGAVYDERYLQIDHRVPYLVAGNTYSFDLEASHYMLVCASCNRAKSWSCEHCPNGLSQKSIAICQACYWGNPINYSHIATLAVRRIELIWQGEEIHTFEALQRLATNKGLDLATFLKHIIKLYIETE